MVTEILRPISLREFGGPISSVPSDLPLELGYTCINEVSPDDGASFIDTGTLSFAVIDFSSPMLINSYSKIISCRVVVRVKCGNTNTDCCLALSEINEEGEETQKNKIQIPVNSTDWKTVYGTFDAADIIASIESRLSHPEYSINTFGTTVPLGIMCGGALASGSSGKQGGIYYSQVYVEITYDDSEETDTDIIYLKENDSWISVPCTIYQKQNGTWVSVDSTIFENGDKYNFIKEDE